MPFFYPFQAVLNWGEHDEFKRKRSITINFDEEALAVKLKVKRLELPNIIMYEEIDRFLLAILDLTDIVAPGSCSAADLGL